MYVTREAKILDRVVTRGEMENILADHPRMSAHLQSFILTGRTTFTDAVKGISYRLHGCPPPRRVERDLETSEPPPTPAAKPAPAPALTFLDQVRAGVARVASKPQPGHALNDYLSKKPTRSRQPTTLTDYLNQTDDGPEAA